MKKQIVFLLLLSSVSAFSQENKTEIKSVTIKKTKKAVEQKADRTIFDFSEQAHLNTGTALERIKKLPGLMSSDLTGMSYQGKPLAVFMDSRPLNINSTELNSFLEGIPASSIERIEIITNPSAEFPATGGGAILNIITSSSAKSYLTATYSGNYSFSNYDKYRNKTNQSILLNSKNKWFGWQLNAGANYRENMNKTAIDEISDIFSDDINRGYFARTALSFDLGLDRLILNYNINHNHSDETPLSSGNLNNNHYQRLDNTETKRLRQEAVLTYQKRFNDAGKKLDFKLHYNQSNNDFEQDNLFYIINALPMTALKYLNSSDAHTTEFNISYSQDIHLLDGGKLNIGGLYNRLSYETAANTIKNLDYQRQTLSTFAELRSKKGKWDFILGIRGEDYDISGVTYNFSTHTYDELTSFKKYKWFPNASIQYNFSPMVNVSINYNKKINLPSINALNPNSDYNNGSFFSIGNANTQPTIYDNFYFSFSAFNYFFFNYNLGLIDNDVVNRLQRTGNIAYTDVQNISSVKTHNFSAGFPLPLAIFNKPIKEIMRSNPDKMNFLYFVGGYNFQSLPDIKGKNGLWYFNIQGNFILPKEIKLNVNYTFIPSGAGHYYYQADRPIENKLNFTLSKKFLKNQLTLSLFAEDVFNTNQISAHSINQIPNVQLYQKSDSRRFGISVNYKIPTRNKLAKETPNILLEDKKEEESSGIMK